MAMTDGEKAEVKEMAREIVKEVLAEHVAACPHGQGLMRMRATAIGIGVGSGLGSSGIVFALLKIFGA